MDLVIQQLSDGDTALDSLARWLLNDTEVVQRAQVSARRVGNPEGMGAWVEAVNVILTHAEALSSLALSYVAWRRQNPQAASVVIMSGDKHLVDRQGHMEVIHKIENLAIGERESPVSQKPEASRRDF